MLTPVAEVCRRSCKAASRLSQNGMVHSGPKPCAAGTHVTAANVIRAFGHPRRQKSQTSGGHVKFPRATSNDPLLTLSLSPIMSTSPAREGSANAGSSNGNSDEKPRLSEHEKKANHIASGKLFYSVPSTSSYFCLCILWGRAKELITLQ
jgi:hypothetical protein